jgi:hypothetical protein
MLRNWGSIGGYCMCSGAADIVQSGGVIYPVDSGQGAPGRLLAAFPW